MNHVTADREAPLLAVTGLHVTFAGGEQAVRGLGLTLAPAETLAVVGESGAGKTATALAVMGLLPATADVTGSVRLRGRELLGLAAKDLTAVRGNDIAMVFQDSALTPVHRVGDQIAEAVRAHTRTPRRAAAERAVELLADLGVPDAARAARAYPHQLSGGQLRRAMVAIAVAADPAVILADEPTAALDTIAQTHVLNTLQAARTRTGAALILITHDLTIAANHADRVLIMHAGHPVESGTTAEILHHPQTHHTTASTPTTHPNRPAAHSEGTTGASGEPAASSGGPAAHLGGTASCPDGPAAHPDEHAGCLDGSAGWPDGFATYSSGAAARPGYSAECFEGPAGRPDGSAGYSDGSAAYPDRPTARSEGSAGCADGSVAYSGGPAARLHGSAGCPDGPAPHADGSAECPGGAAGWPDGPAAHLDGAGMQLGASAGHFDKSAVCVDESAVRLSGAAACTPPVAAHPPSARDARVSSPPGPCPRHPGGPPVAGTEPSPGSPPAESDNPAGPGRQRALPQPASSGSPVLEVRGLVKHYSQGKGWFPGRAAASVRAVDGIDLDVRGGETLGLVGESGCGKTTTLREVVRLGVPQSGRITVFGRDTATLSGRERRTLRRDLHIVFQDPLAALDPRMTVGRSIAEPLRVRRRRTGPASVPELLRLVGLDPAYASHRPGELSGGQRQRVCLARALACDPKLLLLDEPFSALDLSAQAGVVALLRSLRTRLGLSYLIAAHDLTALRRLADRLAVMHLGRIAEIGDTAAVHETPAHPYTRILLSAGPSREAPAGMPPPPTGCRFRASCTAYAALTAADRQRCVAEEPAVRLVRPGQAAACHFPLQGRGSLR